MDALTIKATEDTPNIHFNAGTGVLEISGRSLPEDAAGFYSPVMDWLKKYAQTPAQSTTLLMKLEYFNTASSKVILDVFNLMASIPSAKKIDWYYAEDDEDMQEAGQEFSELVDVSFEYKTY